MPDNPYQSPSTGPPPRRRWRQSNTDAIIIGTGLSLLGTPFLLAGLWITVNALFAEDLQLHDLGWVFFFLLVLVAGAASVIHGLRLVIRGLKR